MPTSGNRKYLLDWKLRIEAVRKATELSGYEWWLGISDYWGGSNGIFDFFGEDKVFGVRGGVIGVNHFILGLGKHFIFGIGE